MGNPAILIVEDSGAVRAALRRFVALAFPQAAIHEAHDGAAALSLARAYPLRLVLLDIALAGANGLELISPLRHLRPAAEIVVVSQFDEPSYVEHALSAGAFGYVTKDRLVCDLLPLVRRALEAAC